MILQLILQSTGIIFVYMTAGYIIARLKKEISIVDIMWGIGFIMIAWFSLLTRDLFLPRQLLATFCVTIWGTRLSWYIWYRKKGEDARYAQLKKKWGSSAPLYTFIFVFMLQGAFLLLIASSILIINASNVPNLYFFDYCGFGLWLFGFGYEILADWQLHCFIIDPRNKGKLLQTGLWSLSRHPNYFGELVLWSGLCIVALSLPFGWYALLSPLTLLFIFFSISIPATEKTLADNPDFVAYKKETNALVPRFK